MTYTFTVEPNEITLETNGSTFTFAGKTISLSNSRYAISYYGASNHYEREQNTLSILFEKMSGKTRAYLLNRTMPVSNLHALVPKAYTAVPVYLDIVEATGVRSLVQLNLNDQACQDFITEIITLHPNAYLGMGNQNNTDSALGLNQANKVLMYVGISVLLFIVIIMVGVLISSN